MSSSVQPQHNDAGAPLEGGEWQLKCSTVSASLGHLFMNSLYSDIRFVPLMGASDPPKVFPAHSFVLSIRSPVFETQFRWDKNNAKAKGENSVGETDDSKIQEVELADVDPVGFEEFLRFLYTDQANITRENIASIYYIANRYMVPSLKKYIRESVEVPRFSIQTEEILKELMNPERKPGTLDKLERYVKYNERTSILKKMETVFELLKIGEKYDDGEAKNCALKAICEHSRAMVESKAFLEIDQKTLTLIARQEKLKLEESELFNGLIRWAEKRQETENGKSLRELIGEEALFRVQFWRMSALEVANAVVPKTVLTPDETIYLFRKLAETSRSFNEDCPFPRFGILRGDGKMLTLRIKSVQQFANSQKSKVELESETVSVNGSPFCINVCIRKDEEKSGEKFLDFSVCYEGCQCRDCKVYDYDDFGYDDYGYAGAEKASCCKLNREEVKAKVKEEMEVETKVLVQWMIPSFPKNTNGGGRGRDRVGLLVETELGEGSFSRSYKCTSVPLGELLDPESGLLAEDGSLTLRATVAIDHEKDWLGRRRYYLYEK